MPDDFEHVSADPRIVVRNPRGHPRGIIGLTNAQLWAKRHPKTFKIPSDRWIKKVKPGDWVKIGRNRERFWVKVGGWEGKKWHGLVWNKLIWNDDLRHGTSIYFYKKNIMAIQFKGRKTQADFRRSKPAKVSAS